MSVYYMFTISFLRRILLFVSFIAALKERYRNIEGRTIRSLAKTTRDRDRERETDRKNLIERYV